MPYSIEPMRLTDIPEVEAIERQSFSSPWSRRAYEYDLKQNPLAHYLVVREREQPVPEPQDEAPRPGAANAWVRWISSAVGIVTRALGVSGPPTTDGQPPQAQPPVLGFAGVWMMVGEAHLVTLAVEPSHRRQGLGELLLVSVIDLACQLHASTMYLEVRVSNTGAKALYEKYGFAAGRVRKGYYSDNGEDALEMVAEGIATARFQARLQRLKRLLAEKLSA